MRRLIALIFLSSSLLLVAIFLIKNTRPFRREPQETDYQSDLGEVFNILIIGNDARLLFKKLPDGRVVKELEPRGRSDIINIAHINLKKGIVNLINIPRDMLVHIPGYTKAESDTDFCHMDKINHSYFFGQEKLLIAVLQRNFNIPIHRYLTINLSSFQEIFSFLLPYLKNLTLRNRPIRNAQEARYLLRSRKIWKRDDIDRGRNSLIFIKLATENLWGLLSKPIFRANLVKGVMKIIGKDTDLTFDDIMYILSHLKQNGFKPSSLQMATLIGFAAPVYLHRYQEVLSCYLPVYPEIKKQIAHFIFESEEKAKSYLEDEPFHLPSYLLRTYYPIDSPLDSVKTNLENPPFRSQTQEF